ncbi:hypothetical protein BDR07DRAFT_1426980 [Suillus spraguei]|nr:hypothetical protein BDR07DRAFT_1426980 [Suillus spraguei]
MTIISNDPSWWPTISWNILFSYWAVAAGVVVVYDWVLTLGQEVELIWRQRWSLITVLYLVLRYMGIPCSVIGVLQNMPFVSVTDAGCNIVYYAVNVGNVVAAAVLGVIMIARLHAINHRSRIMLIFLVVTYLAINIACVTITVVGLRDNTWVELILSGTYLCGFENDTQLLYSMVWMLNTVWEVLALCLSVWVTVKHFRDLRRLGPSRGSIIGDCLKVLMKSHALYFASFLGVSALQFYNLSPEFLDSDSIGDATLSGIYEVLSAVQMFVLGPRLILSVRDYNAKLVADSDAETTMNSIVFQERVHISTSSTI